ncbi:hypothetical protein [Chromobacterium subtsugae]|uniref:hypothetical protein n=1 Tax=Chromobacterium subtsugae TaxID=251747 RepID=UPI00064181F0|nr:hypothetical protein [Chromobacterium subtsugae]
MSVITPQSSVSRLDLWQRTSIVAKPSTDAAPSSSSADAQAQSQAARLSTAPNDLQQALNRGWQDYMQKLRVDLNRPAQRQSPQADDIQKKMLKQQADALRQMMMVTRDKASLRALATQLARLARELKDLVSSMTQNAADQQMAVNVGGDQASGGVAASSAAEASAGSDAGSGGDSDAQAASAEAAAAASSAQAAPAAADGADAQQAASGQSNAQDASAADANANAQASSQSDAQGNSGNVDPQAALRNMLANGNPVAGDPDIEQIRQVLKMVQAFIKQMAQQLQTQKDSNSRDLKDDMKRADKDLEDVDKILKGGPEAMAALNGQMDVNINVSADAGAANA